MKKLMNLFPQKWNEKALNTARFETIQEYQARGGIIQVFPPGGRKLRPVVLLLESHQAKRLRDSPKEWTSCERAS